MKADVACVRAYGLDRLDSAELAEHIAANSPDDVDSVEFEDARPVDGYGEPGTIIAIVAFTALKGFVAWLSLRQRNKHITQDVEIELTDGTKIKSRIDIKIPAGGDPEPEVIRALIGSPLLPEDARAALEQQLSA